MEKRKEFLVCIDSDGCVMDTMDLKHDKCLAPCMLMVWDLGKYKIELTARWREINLYSLDRGTNRFRVGPRDVDDLQSLFWIPKAFQKLPHGIQAKYTSVFSHIV